MSYSIQQGLFKYDIVDYHAILGVPLGASAQEVRLRYLAIAQALHPDTCKAQGTEAKEQASQLFSKLVNPAYENLGKARSRSDYLLVLSQTAKTLVSGGKKITLTSELANQLDQEADNIDLTYRRLLQSLIEAQYKDINTVLQKIGQLSELNLVYLKKTAGDSLQSKSQLPSQPTAKSPEKPAEVEQEIPPIVRYIRRAREEIERKNLTTALLELRDAVKLDPNNSTCHSLLGLTYLQQKQLKMAKIHINQAYKIDPKNPDAIEAKKALDKLIGKIPPESSGGILGKLFGGKKNKT